MLQDKLTGALIGLARAVDGNEELVTENTDRLVIESLFTTITNVNFNDETIEKNQASNRSLIFLFA